MKKVLEQQFKSSYNRKSFTENILDKIFFGKCKNYKIFSGSGVQNIPLSDSELSIAKSLVKYGTITTNDDRIIDFYEVILHDNKLVEKNKVGISTLVKKQIIGNNAVFVNFAYENPENKNWRFSFIAFDSIFEKGDIKTKETNPKRYTYVFGEKDETYKTAIERFSKLSEDLEIYIEKIKEAFAVEAMSEKFFNEYRDIHYKAFVEHLCNSNFKKSVFNEDDKLIRDFVKKLLGRIVFLYFIQKKGWLGASTIDYIDGDKNFIKTLFSLSGKNDSFYSVWLCKLFFDTLNEKRTDDDFEMPDGKIVKIPYLNGGLFERDKSDHEYITIEAELFKKLFEFFDQYNFTVYEDSPDDHTIAVDPEMLGHIFENLLEDNKDKGTFYTPKEIVHYMTQESLIEYLHTHLADISIDNLTDFVKGKEVELSKANLKKIEKLLDDVKICDPAIGSGAFPMGLLQEIFSLKERIAFLSGFKVWSPATVKEHIIQNSIYGVDIEKGAVDIARLRFWLSLIVDEDKPKPLPNLDYKIVVGNSLVSKFENEVIEINWELEDKKQGDLYNGIFELENKKQELLKKISEKQSEYFYSETNSKDKISAEIRKLKLDILSTQLKLMIEQSGENYIAKGSKSKKQLDTELTVSGWKRTLEKINFLKKNNNSFEHFDWKLDFPEILNPLVSNGKRGFDIVIGNPPYIKEYTNKNAFDGFRDSNYYQGKMDIWYGFACIALDLLKNSGLECFIAQNNWVTSAGASIFRNKVLSESEIKIFTDFWNYKVFNTAGIQTMVYVIKKCKPINSYKLKYSILKKDNLSKEELSNFLDFNLKTDYSNKTVLNFDNNSYKDGYIYFNNNELDNILTKIVSKDTFFLNEDEVANGIHSHHDFVNKKMLEILGGDFSVGNGIFGLSKDEYRSLNFNSKEKELLKRYYPDTKYFYRYFGRKVDDNWIIYTTSEFKNPENIKPYPNIKKHLDKFKDIITSDNKPYGLHRARKEHFFTGEKIVAQRKCPNRPVFTYLDFDSYLSATFYVIKTNRVNLKFLTAILNSKLITFWLRYKGKMQGNNYQIDKEPLVNIPIIKSKNDKSFITLVDYILFVLSLDTSNKLNEFVSNTHISETFEEVIDAMVFELYFPDDFKKANINIIKYVERDFKPIDGLEPEMKKKIIHDAYQKLRESNNEIRNNIKLMKIELRDLLMPILTV